MSITVLKWGSLSLTVSPTQILTFTGYNRRTAYKTETQDNGTNKPKTVNKGPELDTLSINVEVMAMLGVDVAQVIKQWRDACQSGKENTLTIGGVKEGSNKWQVKDVTVTNTTYQKNVKDLASATLQINFVEWYAKPATKKKSKKKKKKKSSSRTVQNSTTSNPTQQGNY